MKQTIVTPDSMRRTTACKERLESYLRENQVEFELHHHPVAYTARETAEAEHVASAQVAKVVLVVADYQMVMLVLPASCSVDLDAASRLLGAQDVRLAEERDLAVAFPDCEVGAMPPFGVLYGLPTWADATLSEQERIVFQAGTHTESITMRYADFDRLVRPSIGAFTRPRTA